MASTRVEVHIFKDDDNGRKRVFEETIQIRVFSNKRHGTLMSQDILYATAKMYRGGVLKMVEQTASLIAETMNHHPKYKDDHDVDAVAKAAVEAFKEAALKAEQNGFGRYVETSIDEKNVIVKATGGRSET